MRFTFPLLVRICTLCHLCLLFWWKACSCFFHILCFVLFFHTDISEFFIPDMRPGSELCFANDSFQVFSPLFILTSIFHTAKAFKFDEVIFQSFVHLASIPILHHQLWGISLDTHWLSPRIGSDIFNKFFTFRFNCIGNESIYLEGLAILSNLRFFFIFGTFFEMCIVILFSKYEEIDLHTLIFLWLL